MLIIRVMFTNFVNIYVAHFFGDHKGILILKNLGAHIFIYFLCVFRGNYEMTKIQ